MRVLGNINTDISRKVNEESLQFQRTYFFERIIIDRPRVVVDPPKLHVVDRRKQITGV